MFSSLARIDVTAEKDGRTLFVQTDHRTTAEIEADPELSVAFALIRMTNPLRMVEEGESKPLIVYSSVEPLPEFLALAVRSVGGAFMVGDDFTLLTADDGPTVQLDDLIQTTFRNLAEFVSKESSEPITVVGLRELETSSREMLLEVETGTMYWSAVVKLGAFAGEVLRRANGGQWVQATQGTLPFSLRTTFNGVEVTVNPLGKAIKFYAEGENESVAELVRVLVENP